MNKSTVYQKIYCNKHEIYNYDNRCGVITSEFLQDIDIIQPHLDKSGKWICLK